ncbi:MAG: AAA family ATPase [Epulopiscium sp. Nele67-Bin005]|nr:MAG: AAA family ATPase [Epulopiscium sp. Nele67-Bin005]
MEEQVVVEGVIEDIIYQNKDNGYTVCTINYEGADLCLVGSMPNVYEGDELHVQGVFVMHHVYGKQLKVSSFTQSEPKTVQGIEKYLASGAIKGIGAKTANKIVKHFGLDTFKIIENEPQVLAQVSGITPKKALQIGEVFKTQYEMRTAMMALQEYGISPTYAVKIYKEYKERTVEILKKNPYQLASDIHGIGFKKADDIANQLGIDRENVERIKTGVIFVLNKETSNGHTYMPQDLLIWEATKLLAVSQILVENAILELKVNKELIIKQYENGNAVFLAMYYYSEMNIAKKLVDLTNLYDPEALTNVDNDISQTEKDLSITLVQEQKDAIKTVLQYGVVVITGGPGTGKTTTIKALIDVLRKQDLEIMLTAPTGRASKRMSEATGETAQTIHKTLEINFNPETDKNKKKNFQRDEDNPLETDILIVDEVSMVDVNLMNSLLKALVVGQRLVLIGDVDQLPSVGAGNVLKDIIASGKIPTIRLQQIFRQANESAIIRNAHKINKGEYPLCNEHQTDFFFMKRAVQEELKVNMVDLIIRRLPKYQNIDSLRDIQVLSPMKKGPLGIVELNKSLQDALNPSAPNKPEKEYRQNIFRVGDKVMQIKNNYNIPWKIYSHTHIPEDEGIGVFNGDCGIITQIDTEKEKVVVTFEDRKTVHYEFSNLDELELAYAITIHKSQGSEYPIVIIPLHSGPPMLLSRNLLYTAVTRAKQMVVIVGLQETVCKMVDNNREIQRYSSLEQHLVQIAN